MPDHDSIYASEADKYHQLIDKQPDLDKIIDEIRPYSGLDIVDLGAGTGRLTAVLAAKAKTIIALDAFEDMLRINEERLSEAGHTNWTTKVADHRSLPLENNSADLIVSGWSICYSTNTGIPEWEQNLGEIINELKRVLRPNGTIIIFETMGTGFEEPSPPEFLKPYYAALEQDYGFSHKWIRMDYQFDNAEQAEELTRFFFDEELANKVAAQKLVQLPECAGVWWLHL